MPSKENIPIFDTMNRLIVFIGIFCLLAVSHDVRAVWQVPTVNYDKSDYKAGTQNWAVAKSNREWLYFANNYGLLEFDGYNWQLYGIWNSSPVRSVVIADDGGIYVGGVGEFGCFRYDADGQLNYNSLSQKMFEQYGNIGDIWDIHPCKGNIFVRTRDELYIVSEPTGDILRLNLDGLLFASALIGEKLYVVSENGLLECSANGDFKVIRGTEFLGKYDVRNITHFADGQMLVSTHFNGLFLFDGLTLKPFKTEADDYIRKNMLYTMAVNDDNIAVGTVSGGVVVVDRQGGNPKYVTMHTGLQNNTVLSLMFDSANDLWCGLDQGIDRVSVSSPLSELYSKVASLGSGYAQAIHNGRLYLGTNRGLFYSRYPFDTPTQTFDAASVEGSIGQVWELQVVGNELFCMHDKGFFRIDDGRLTVVNDTDGFWQIRKLPLNDNYAVVGAYTGLYLMRREADGMKLLWRIKNFSQSAKTFEIDNNNRIWIVTDKGVERITLNGAMTEASPEVVLPHPGGTVYHNVSKLGERIVVSQGSQSYITNEHNNLSESVGALALLDGRDVFYSNITEDADGNIWYITDGKLKICRFDPTNKKYADKAELIWNMAEQMVYGFTHLMPTDNGEVVVGVVDGFVKANANKAKMASQTFRPKVFVRRMEGVTNTNVREMYVTNGIVLSKEIEIPFISNSVRFVYGCSQCYDNMEEYSCSLTSDGEELYSDWTVDHVKEYTFLNPGEYTFKVKSRTRLGIETEPYCLTFTILPPWYKTWWAYLLWSVVLTLIVVLMVLIQQRRNALTRRRLIEQNELKLRQQKQLYARQALEHDKEILQLQNEKIESELKSKSEELSNILLNNINRNELITKVRHDLMKITEDLNDKDVKSALKRISMMQSRLITDGEQRINWERFEENFDIVNDKYLKRLQERFPWISDSEKRLCVYIRMGLLNKEMAPLMNITVRGVEMIRYRMRKKMELPPETDLELFLKDLGA